MAIENIYGFSLLVANRHQKPTTTHKQRMEWNVRAKYKVISQPTIRAFTLAQDLWRIGRSMKSPHRYIHPLTLP